VRREVDRPVLARLARRIVAEVIAALPVARRTDRPWREAAAAVRADIGEQLDAAHAVGALEAADARIERLRRQHLVAVLAIRSHFQHRSTFRFACPPRSARRARSRGILRCRRRALPAAPAGLRRDIDGIACQREIRRAASRAPRAASRCRPRRARSYRSPYRRRVRPRPPFPPCATPPCSRNTRRGPAPPGVRRPTRHSPPATALSPA